MDSIPRVVVLVRVFEDGLSWISRRAYLIIRNESRGSDPVSG
jgi:hypothetical protein